MGKIVVQSNKVIKKSKMGKKDWFDVLSYVIWTISLYILSYYTLKRADNIDMVYQIAALSLMISCIWLYKVEERELTKEILKCTLILIGTAIFPPLLGDEVLSLDAIKDLVALVICNVINATIGYFVIFYIRKSRDLHGNATYKLETVTLLITGFLMFILKWDVVLSLIVAGVCNMLIGYCVYKKNWTA